MQREPRKRALLLPPLPQPPQLPQLLTSSASIVSLTSCATATPPASSAWFHVSPKSRRSIFPVAENPILTPPQGSELGPVISASSVTGRVVPRIVRSPSKR